MSEIQPDEVLRNSFQQAISVALQLWGTWEQRKQRQLMQMQAQLEQEQTEALEERHQDDRDQADLRDPDAQRQRMDQERIRQSWPLVEQVSEAWVEQAAHHDLARVWAFASRAEQMAADPARRAAAGAAADVIEGQLRRRAPGTMRQYEAARSRGMTRLQAMEPLAAGLDGEAAVTVRPRTTGPTATTTRTTGPAAASAPQARSQASSQASAADRIRQACRNAAASWGTHPFGRPAAAADAVAHADPSWTATVTSVPRRGR